MFCSEFALAKCSLSNLACLVSLPKPSIQRDSTTKDEVKLQESCNQNQDPQDTGKRFPTLYVSIVMKK